MCLTRDETRLFVMSHMGSPLPVIDTATLTVTARVQLPTLPEIAVHGPDRAHDRDERPKEAQRGVTPPVHLRCSVCRDSQPLVRHRA